MSFSNVRTVGQISWRSALRATWLITTPRVTWERRLETYLDTGTSRRIVTSQHSLPSPEAGRRSFSAKHAQVVAHSRLPPVDRKGCTLSGGGATLWLSTVNFFHSSQALNGHVL